MAMARLQRRVRGSVLLLLVASCASCLVVPIGLFNERPYDRQLLVGLQQADRGQVRRLLGEPLMTRAAGRYWYYADSRALVGLLVDTHSEVFEQYFWLLVRFDEHGRVDFAESARFPACLSNGQCLDGTASRDDTIRARNHRPAADECAVYLYLQALPLPLNSGGVDYRVDGRKVGRVDKHSFVLLTHRPGPIRIAAYDLAIGTDCEAGDRLYIQAVKKRDLSWDTGADLAPVSQAEGAAAIATRRLALPD